MWIFFLAKKETSMRYYIAVFRARSETFTFATLLRSYNISAQIINTPRKVNVSCGVSVKFEAKYLNVAQEILSRRKFDTFVSFFPIWLLTTKIDFQTVPKHNFLGLFFFVFQFFYSKCWFLLDFINYI